MIARVFLTPAKIIFLFLDFDKLASKLKFEHNFCFIHFFGKSTVELYLHGQ